MKFHLSIALFAAFICSSNIVQAGGAGDTSESEITFRTPSKNIYCVYDPNEAFFGCERLKPSYAFVHAANPIDYEDREIRKNSHIFVLAYGKSWKAPDGQITCFSKTTGLVCKSPDGFGFALSKAAVKMFEP